MPAKKLFLLTSHVKANLSTKPISDKDDDHNFPQIQKQMR